jgi:3-phenylpropionate/trans-cinnamate dioxygenase ferredoxin reductase subunit
MNHGIVIAGGGLAGQRCCETLRARGYDGPLRMVCAEPDPPYDRPPLSKELLAGKLEREALTLRPARWHEENDVELLLGRRAARLDASAHAIVLEDGERLPYEQLLVATGSAPRRLPAAKGFENAHTLRTAADAESLREELRPGSRLVVVGAGFIGLEVTATARELGVEVMVVEAAAVPLEAVLGPDLGRWFAELHADEGVDMRLATGLEELRGNGRAEEVTLTGGERLACDVLLVGIGVRPDTGWLEGSGLPADGVPVDPAGRTALPGVFAAGDAALPFDDRMRGHVRSEHWEAAVRGGQAAARAMLGLEPGRALPPSFWSDQYGIRVQYLGRSAGADSVEVDGDPAQRDFAAIWRRDGRPVAALLVGRPHALPEMRKTLASDEGTTR